MTYKKKEFDGCSFNPLAEGKMLEEYPRLVQIIESEWTADPYLDQLIRYIIMVYDPVSPLIKGERDMNYRKDIALELTNIEDEGIREAIVMHTHEYSPDLAVRYLMRFPKSKEFAAICTYEYCFWESIRKLNEPISGKDTKAELESVQKKAAIKEEVERDIKRLDALYKSFFGEDIELEKRGKKRITPESVANGSR